MVEAVGVILVGLGILVLIVLGLRRPRRDSPLKLKSAPLLPDEGTQLDVLGELERVSQAARVRAKRDEKTRRWLRPIGFFGRFLAYAALFFALYIYWPKDITKTPIASLTLSDILGTAGAILIGFSLIRALLNPSEDDEAKDGWGVLGIIMSIGLAGFALFYLGAHVHPV